jgi:hypothetical protein
MDNLISFEKNNDFCKQEKLKELNELQNVNIENKGYLLDSINNAKCRLNNIIDNKGVLLDDEILELSLYLDRLLILYIKNSEVDSYDREEKCC